MTEQKNHPSSSSRNRQKYILMLCSSLLLLWLLLSGHYTMLLLTLGGLSVALVTVIALRMEVVDQEGQPLNLNLWRLLLYWVWLLGEIIKADIRVCRIILSPSLPIKPVVVRHRLQHNSNMARVLYANSVTLTPGTLTIDVDQDTIEVHALTEEQAADVIRGTMAKRSCQVEK